jgi:two-component system, chemotaxis family, protein-glutamate methylesterase/glutaminase
LIKVLVVEDSAVVRELLQYILGSDPGIRVVGTAANGEEALAAVERVKPDVITMDVHMPGMNGFDVTRRIMERRPTPIVIVSGTLDPRETTTAFRALESGALAILEKPTGIGNPDFGQTCADLIRTVKTMAEVKVVRRWARPAADLTAIAGANAPAAAPHLAAVAVGASTGGPPVLQLILSQLPETFSVPVLIVQHIASGFVAGFVDWLAQSSRLPVHIASHGETILPGHVYVAPDGFHLMAGSERHIVLSQDEPEHGLRPSVSALFRSVAKVYGRKAIGVLLSGMGKDGATELRLMKELGAVTIAQDRESSVVHGMPGEAIRLDATTYVLPPEKIAPALASLVNEGSAWVR